MATAQRLIVVPEFFDGAREMRASYDERFGSPRASKRSRFVWDYFHVPGQYTYVRTMVENAFPLALYSNFLHRLRSWGRDRLGCDRIVSPWLSYFVDGCRQELHTDVPHGPWAFVFSLTDWDHCTFTGGETMLLTPECLDYWRSFEPSASREAEYFVEMVPPRFNQLTVFDPRIPHGVRTVQGTGDPLASRIILHGWFREPSICLSETLEGKLSVPIVQAAVASLENRLASLDGVTGLLTARVELDPGGSVASVEILSNTLVSSAGRMEETGEAAQTVVDFLRATKFPAVAEAGWIILPVKVPRDKTGPQVT